MIGGGPVILALRQYPQGRAGHDGTDRHCGLDPQSRGEGPGRQQDKTTDQIPPPLMREESKSLSQCLTLGS